MKRILVCVVLLVMLVSILSSCGNHQIVDFNWTFTKAILMRGDGEQLIEVSKWNEYEDGAIQIIAKDGTIYYTHLINVILIEE